MDDIDAALKDLSARVDALRRAMDTVMNGTAPDLGKWGAFGSFARAYNTFAERYASLVGGNGINLYRLDKLLGRSSTPWPRQKELFDTVYADVLILGAALSGRVPAEEAPVSAIQDLLAANLRKVVFTRPEREVEVQNAVEALLVGRGHQRGVAYDREAGKVRFSGKEFIPDFVFPGLRLALEVKLVKDRAGVAQCVEEMSADIPAYRSAYDNVLFCVYDLGEIRDVGEFQEGLQKQAGVRVCVTKH